MPSDLSSLDTGKLSDQLRKAIAAGLVQLRSTFDEQSAGVAPRPGKWSAKEVVGHLIDSAANNHQRVVRLNIDSRIDTPGYKQNEWVSVQGYAQRGWEDLLTLWEVLNLHLAEAIQRTPHGKLGHIWLYEGEAITLGFIIEDYIAHMEHHLGALKA